MQQTLTKRPVRTYFGASALAFLGLLFLLVPLLPPPDLPLGSWGAFLGRFHPLIVHFPIAFVLLPLVLEGLARLTKRDAFLTVLPVFWGLAVLSCVAAVGAGYLLYASGGYTGDLVQQHLWGGAALTACVFVGAALCFFTPIRSARPWYRAYLAVLLAANGILVYTGHMGGSLTHGEAFLTDALPDLGGGDLDLASKPPEELLVFQDLLMPALETRCQSCHNEHKTKGDLLMTSFETLDAGGESGRPPLSPGDPEASELYRRVTLAPDDDDHMPPSGKPPLDADEIALLHWWIAEGADPEMRLGDGPADPALRAVVQNYLPRLIHTQRRRLRDARARAELARELDDQADAWGLVIALDPDTDSKQFAASMRVPPVSVDDATLAALRPYAEAFSKLSLVSSDITDDGLYHLGRMTVLQRLYLQRTPITGSGLVYLQALPRLTVLNLSHTALDDTGALYLLNFPALEQVYLYGTEVSPSMLEALRVHRPDVEFLQTEGPFF